MSRDASLDEFVGGSAVESEESDVESGESDDYEESGEVGVKESVVETDDEEVSGEGVSPASSTYVWTPAGDNCSRCGDSAGRLWRCSEELVCGECKEW